MAVTTEPLGKKIQLRSNHGINQRSANKKDDINQERS